MQSSVEDSMIDAFIKEFGYTPVSTACYEVLPCADGYQVNLRPSEDSIKAEFLYMDGTKEEVELVHGYVFLIEGAPVPSILPSVTVANNQAIVEYGTVETEVPFLRVHHTAFSALSNRRLVVLAIDNPLEHIKKFIPGHVFFKVTYTGH